MGNIRSYLPARGFGQNVSRAGSAQIDALLDKVATDQDRTQQAADANAVDTLLWDQMATLPLHQKPTLLAHDSSLRDVRNNAGQSGALWNSDDWTLRQWSGRREGTEPGWSTPRPADHRFRAGAGRLTG